MIALCRSLILLYTLCFSTTASLKNSHLNSDCVKSFATFVSAKRCLSRQTLNNKPLWTLQSIKSAIDEGKNSNHDETKYDPVTDWNPPPQELYDRAKSDILKPLQRLSSPIFFSTDQNGKHHLGLSRLPREDERPLLFVGNHQLWGIDMWMMIPQILEERNITVRGLGHPIIFKEEDGDSFGNGGTVVEGIPGGAFGMFRTFGAVEANPMNFYRLMQTGQAVLHFPGGAREAYHGKKEAYQLFWPENMDFIRTAAKFNATVVPVSAIGAADSAYFFVDPLNPSELPFGLGRVLNNLPLSVGAARFDEKSSDYIRTPPLVIPKPLPARHYFLFGRSVSTRHLDHKDKNACREMYKYIQGELKDGINCLLCAREKDPFKRTVLRYSFEQIYGKQAPTFSLDELNKCS